MNDSLVDLSHTRCAVLGAGGFIGTNLCRALVGKVGALRAFGRRQSFPGAIRGCEWVEGDFTDPTCLPAAIAGCEVVFHLVNASTPAGANIDMIADLNANVVSTLRLLDACREVGVRRVVFVSSGGTIYGIPDQVPTPESAPTNPITSYGISKLAIERYLGLYEYLYGLDYRVLRVANPFGPYQTALKNQGVIAAFIRRALAGKPIEIWGDGSVTRDYVYIDDVVKALTLAATYDGSHRIFNIGSGEGRSLNEIAASIGKLLATEIPMIRRSGRSVDVPLSILDTSIATKYLRWRPYTSFEKGLSSTIAWLKSSELDTRVDCH